MRFDLVDRVLEQTGERIVTVKAVTAAEEYLADHFPTFPVLPGVLMLEAMVQAARRLLAGRSTGAPLVLGRVRALKYGRFVRPGDSIRVEVTLNAAAEDGSFDLKGQVLLVAAGATVGAASGGDLPVAASGRLLMRPARVTVSG